MRGFSVLAPYFVVRYLFSGNNSLQLMAVTRPIMLLSFGVLGQGYVELYREYVVDTSFTLLATEEPEDGTSLFIHGTISRRRRRDDTNVV